MKISNNLTKKIRRNILEMTYAVGGSHIGCSLGIVEILVALYFKVMNINPKKPQLLKRDKFILSKGHACTALYATLAERGFFPETKLKEYCQDGSKLAAHVTLGSLPGIEATAGSLGHGLPMGAGMALAFKNKGMKNNVYVLNGDGECMEGSVWEAVIFSAHHKLDNLTLVIDNNNLITLGNIDKLLNIYPFDRKLKSFGWATCVIDGHNINTIIRAFKTPHKDKPLAIIARTIKGKGVSFMENRKEWHGKCPTKEQYEQALKELTLNL